MERGYDESKEEEEEEDEEGGGGGMEEHIKVYEEGKRDVRSGSNLYDWERNEKQKKNRSDWNQVTIEEGKSIVK